MVFAVLQFMDYHFGIFKLVLQIYKVYIIPQYITIYNTFITVDAQNPYYDVVQYHPYDNIETWCKNFYHYFVYFPLDVYNQYVSYHVSAEMIPIIANR